MIYVVVVHDNWRPPDYLLKAAVRGMHQTVVIRSTISSRLFFKPNAKPNSAGRDAPKVLKSSPCAILSRPLLSGLSGGVLTPQRLKMTS